MRILKFGSVIEWLRRCDLVDVVNEEGFEKWPELFLLFVVFCNIIMSFNSIEEMKKKL